LKVVYKVHSAYNTIMVFWVLGYGSLIWNPGFEYDEKVVGFIKDYRRIFDLGNNTVIQFEYVFHHFFRRV